MIFPIGDDQVVGGSRPLVSYSLLVANTLLFLWIVFGLDTVPLDDIYDTWGAIPGMVTAGERWWTLITSMFFHGGAMHLVGNMIFLWVFADNIESSIGSVRFTIFYLLGGLFAGVMHILFNWDSMVPAIGASGAISAVLGAYMIMFPGSRIRVLILIFFRSARVPAFLFLGIWIAQQLVSGIGAMGTMDMHSGGVAWWAHIGGFIFGVMAGFFFRTIMHSRPGRLQSYED